jgi:hypothetical protein
LIRISTVVLVISLIGIVLIGIAVSALAMTGAIGTNLWDDGHNYSRPPCDQLQNQQTVARALASNPDLVAQLEAVGSGVTVDIDTPCDDQPDRALVRITYDSDDEWDGINAIMTQQSFGVGVDVVKD